jgi:hypothetical protein
LLRKSKASRSRFIRVVQTIVFTPYFIRPSLPRACH